MKVASSFSLSGLTTSLPTHTNHVIVVDKNTRQNKNT